MRIIIKTIVFNTLILFWTHVGTAGELPGSAGTSPLVFVSIAPQKYIVQQIGKDHGDIRVMVAPGKSPATYEPRPRQMADLSRACIYFSIGVPFEDVWLKRIAAANPEMKIIPTDHEIKKIPMASHRHPDEEVDPHPEDEHTHQNLDPHIWLSPPLVKKQAHAVLTALVEIDPSHGPAYKTNYMAFCSEIDALDERLTALFEGKQGLRFMVFHPSWGYFARTYGLEQVVIEVEGKNPKPAQLKTLIQLAEKDGIKVVFVQPQFSSKSARLIANEIGGQVVFADPLAEEWPSNLHQVADKFKAALK